MTSHGQYHCQMADAPTQNPRKKRKTAATECDSDSDSSGEELPDMAMAVLIAAFRQPDMNMPEFSRTLSDDDDIKEEEVPLSDSKLPPRREIKKKKKTKKAKAKKTGTEIESETPETSKEHDNNVSTQSESKNTSQSSISLVDNVR